MCPINCITYSLSNVLCDQHHNRAHILKQIIFTVCCNKIQCQIVFKFLTLYFWCFNEFNINILKNIHKICNKLHCVQHDTSLTTNNDIPQTVSNRYKTGHNNQRATHQREQSQVCTACRRRAGSRRRPPNWPALEVVSCVVFKSGCVQLLEGVEMKR